MLLTSHFKVTMKPVHFRGVNYDPLLLSKLAIQGHRETVPTAKVSAIASHRGAETCVAVKIDDTYHLLTGAVDKTKPAIQLVVVSTYTLKKAVQTIVPYTERQQQRREETGQDTSRWGAHIQNNRFNR